MSDVRILAKILCRTLKGFIGLIEKDKSDDVKVLAKNMCRSAENFIGFVDKWESGTLRLD